MAEGRNSDRTPSNNVVAPEVKLKPMLEDKTLLLKALAVEPAEAFVEVCI